MCSPRRDAVCTVFPAAFALCAEAQTKYQIRLNKHATEGRGGEERVGEGEDRLGMRQMQRRKPQRQRERRGGGGGRQTGGNERDRDGKRELECWRERDEA